MESPLDHLLRGPDYSESADNSSSGSPSPSSDTSSPPPSKSPLPSSPPPSTPSAPPPKSSGSGSPPPSPPSPSQSPSPPSPSQSPSPPSPSPPTPSLSPPPASPQDSGGSPPAPPLDRGSPAAPSRATPSPLAPKRGGGGGESSSLESGGSSSARRKSGSNGDGSAPVGAIVAGVVIGVVAFGLLMAIVACVCCAKRKKRPPHMNMPYYTDEYGNVFFANSMPKWQNSSAMDVHGGGWHAPYSSASGEFSGSYGPPGAPHPPTSPGMPALGFSKSAFSYDELASATGGFSSANLLGQGGFGYVYKGVLAGSGKEVAVKQLKAGSGQGEREFQAEVEIISRVHHRHLVSLVGYCIHGDQRLLVYEYVPNKTLEFHLHGAGQPTLAWSLRWRIALGSAKGLAYLHEDCDTKIIHRDIKAANILLDYNFEPKVSDFGLARIQAGGDTHVSTRVMGTFGYLAPEYATSGRVTDRTDVYSFGVLLLELITGKKPVLSGEPYNDETLVSWARPLLKKALEEAVFDGLIDPELEAHYDTNDMKLLIACAAAAVRHTARSRPRMGQIVRYLEGQLSDEALNAGVAPGQSEEQEDGHAGEEIRRMRRMAFVPGATVTENMSSSYVSEPTSEYGLHPSSSSTSDDAGTAEVADTMNSGTAEGMTRRTRSRRGAGE